MYSYDSVAYSDLRDKQSAAIDVRRKCARKVWNRVGLRPYDGPVDLILKTLDERMVSSRFFSLIPAHKDYVVEDELSVCVM